MRLLVLVVALGLTASAVLELRHRRLELLHAMAVLHLDMERHRRSAWDLQHRVSEATSPAALAAAVGGAAPPAAAPGDGVRGTAAGTGTGTGNGDAAAGAAAPGGFEAIPVIDAGASP